jgi:hypothetical protein
VDAIRALSEHVVRVGYRDLPPAAISAAKTFLQDTIGVGVRQRTEDQRIE